MLRVPSTTPGVVRFSAGGPGVWYRRYAASLIFNKIQLRTDEKIFRNTARSHGMVRSGEIPRKLLIITPGSLLVSC